MKLKRYRVELRDHPDFGWKYAITGAVCAALVNDRWRCAADPAGGTTATIEIEAYDWELADITVQRLAAKAFGKRIQELRAYHPDFEPLVTYDIKEVSHE